MLCRRGEPDLPSLRPFYIYEPVPRGVTQNSLYTALTIFYPRYSDLSRTGSGCTHWNERREGRLLGESGAPTYTEFRSTHRSKDHAVKLHY